MQLILIGYRGVGKSAIGAILARKLKTNLIDTDNEVEKASKMKIHEIISNEGWPAFRKRELQELKKSFRKQAVIAVGGGALTENKVKVPKSAVVVLLTAPISTIKKRIKGSSRPSLSGKGTIKEITEVMNKRMPKYLKLADLVVDTAGKKQVAIANEILRVIK